MTGSPAPAAQRPFALLRLIDKNIARNRLAWLLNCLFSCTLRSN
ncbi:MAG: hypothetical protein ACUVSY_18045 [Roseiflexus sp.]